ncbi:MAG: IclR family transcriptional regulator [Chloroflexi bacterium]|nr:IclR family transcriptional regulator [Chloroflexota bacterium]
MPQPPTRAVDRALDILWCFSEEEPNLTLTQISKRVGMHKSTVYRLLATLEKKRFVQRLDDASYRLGLGLVELGFSVLKNNDIHRQALPYMQRLAAECNENVDLGILDGTEVLYLQVIESQQRVKIASAPGQRLPVFCTATGKAFLAFLPDKQAQTILKSDHRKYTEYTTTLISEIHKQLQLTRERGFAVSEQEYEEGISAVAAPVLDANQYPIAAMAVVGPAFRLELPRLLELGRILHKTTDALARDVGLKLQFSKSQLEV